VEILSHIRVPAKLDNLHELIDFVSGCAKEAGLKDKRVGEIEIAVEEALVNIFNYAYPENGGDVEIACKTGPDGALVIAIIDEGVPFDPLLVAEPDTTLDVDARSIGGIGVFLIRKLMDDVRYRREGSKNILELVVAKTPVNLKP
jgi:anti-sigma regulatory factor (Ser/Thr protein kinase)